MKGLEDLVKKEKNQGVFQAASNIIDKRNAVKQCADLHHGFEISAGNKGNKLSGGQK